MKVATSPMSSLFTPASTSSVASTSRTVLTRLPPARSLHSSPVQFKDGDSASRMSSMLGSLDNSQSKTGGGRFGFGNSQSQPQSQSSNPFAVSSPGSAYGRGAFNTNTADLKRFPKLAQHYTPESITHSSRLPVQKRRAPRILGPTNREARDVDPLKILQLNPAKPSLFDDSYKNPVFLSQWVTEMGRIQPRNRTELTRRSQRAVGKAIRRAQAMGLMPHLSKGNWHSSR